MKNLSRRDFLNLAAAAAPAALLASRTANAADAELPHLDEADPKAKQFGYHADASKLDAKAEATFKSGSHCATCLLYTGAAGSTYGPCGLFPGKAVSSKGWCRSYAARPA